MNQRIWFHRIRSVPLLDRIFWGGVPPAIPADGNDAEPENPVETGIATALLAACLGALVIAAAIGPSATLSCAIASLLAAQMTRLLSIRRYAKHARQWRRALQRGLARFGPEHSAQWQVLEADFSKLVVCTAFALPVALLLIAFGFAWIAWMPQPQLAVQLLVFVQLVLLVASGMTMAVCGARLQRARPDWGLDS